MSGKNDGLWEDDIDLMTNVNFDSLEIRELKAGDEPLINDLFDRMGGESYSLFNRRDYNRKGALRYCARPDAGRKYWIALLPDGTIAGYVFFLDWNTTIPMLGIAVRDDLRGMHIGTGLISFAQETARAAGKGGIQLTTHFANLRGQALYEKMGFQCMGQYRNGQELYYLFRYRDHDVS